MVTWAIDCDEINRSHKIESIDNNQIVETLLALGFKRLLKDGVPYTCEPLVYEDQFGRIWDAMPTSHFNSEPRK